jgi:hypothetical protein
MLGLSIAVKAHNQAPKERWLQRSDDDYERSID